MLGLPHGAERLGLALVELLRDRQVRLVHGALTERAAGELFRRGDRAQGVGVVLQRVQPDDAVVGQAGDVEDLPGRVGHVGAAVEFPLSRERGLQDYRLTFDMIFRY